MRKTVLLFLMLLVFLIRLYRKNHAFSVTEIEDIAKQIEREERE